MKISPSPDFMKRFMKNSAPSNFSKDKTDNKGKPSLTAALKKKKK